MLRYLVTSRTRRRLLALLWGEEARGSTAELAGLAGVAFAGAHAELKAMQRTQLVVSERIGSTEIFSANAEHPHAATMRALVASDAAAAPPPRKDDQRLRRKLVALGAPLAGVAPLPVAPSEELETLVRGAELARRDATVARTLPLCFWKQRQALDPGALAALTAGPDAKHAVGFFLELAGKLGGDRRLAGMARRLRDRRRRAIHDFFVSSSGRGEVVHPFPLAAKWGFRMSMDLESFRALFAKAPPR